MSKVNPNPNSIPNATTTPNILCNKTASNDFCKEDSSSTTNVNNDNNIMKPMIIPERFDDNEKGRTRQPKHMQQKSHRHRQQDDNFSSNSSNNSNPFPTPPAATFATNGNNEARDEDNVNDIDNDNNNQFSDTESLVSNLSDDGECCDDEDEECDIIAPLLDGDVVFNRNDVDGGYDYEEGSIDDDKTAETDRSRSSHRSSTGSRVSRSSRGSRMSRGSRISKSSHRSSRSDRSGKSGKSGRSSRSSRSGRSERSSRSGKSGRSSRSGSSSSGSVSGWHGQLRITKIRLRRIINSYIESIIDSLPPSIVQYFSRSVVGWIKGLLVLIVLTGALRLSSGDGFGNYSNVDDFVVRSFPNASDRMGATAVAGGDDNDNGEVRISRTLNTLADLSDREVLSTDVPFFFHIPRTGGSTVKDVMGACLGFVGATDVGAREGKGVVYDGEKGDYVNRGDDGDDGDGGDGDNGGEGNTNNNNGKGVVKRKGQLEVLEDADGSRYVNVDATTAEGIHRAKVMGLMESGLTDYVVTQQFHAAATLFGPERRGRMFTLIRHPIERAISLFHYLSYAEWEPTYDASLKFTSLEMWARSERIEHNWMVRFLSNEIERDLSYRHLEVAKEVLRSKCLVGLLEHKGESFDRFRSYFGWVLDSYRVDGVECRDSYVHWTWSNKHTHPHVDEGTETYKLLLQMNNLDMDLYNYAKVLFEQQGSEMFGKQQVEEEGTGEVKAEDKQSVIQLV